MPGDNVAVANRLLAAGAAVIIGEASVTVERDTALCPTIAARAIA